MTTLNTLVKYFLSLTLIVLSSSALAENPIVKLETSEGDITVVLFADKSPKTVENFLAHVDEGFYENTVFHRIIDNFMVQGGGFDVDLNRRKPSAKSSMSLKTDCTMTGYLGYGTDQRPGFRWQPVFHQPAQQSST